jgi:hypothetical protein
MVWSCSPTMLSMRLISVSIFFFLVLIPTPPLEMSVKKKDYKPRHGNVESVAEKKARIAH